MISSCLENSMERFQDKRMSGWHMQVKFQSVRKIVYYPLTMIYSSTVRDIYRKFKIPHDGACLMVSKHGYSVQGTGETAGILVHMADRVGFLTGCIAPGKKSSNGMVDGSSREAMQQIFDLMGGFKPGKEARLMVLDW